MIIRAHSLKAIMSIALVAMACVGLVNCGGGGGGSGPTGSVGGDQIMIQPRPPAAGAPDLVVGTPTVSDSSPATGESFTLSATVRNAGDGAATTTTLRYYRSADATITTSDTEVDTETLAGLAASGSSSGSVDLTVPPSPGTYYYGACVDTVTGESDTTNNCSSSIRVVVEERQLQEQGNPDLVVELPSVSDNGPAPGAEFTLSLTVSNVGDGESPATPLRYYRSADATITTSDTEVDTETLAGLAASGSSSGSVDLTVPPSPGTYYYGACVDTVTGESDTTNNCSSSIRVVVEERQLQEQGNPDLVVELPSVSDNGPAPGAEFTLSLTVSNVGDGESPATPLRYYRSTDATITRSDTAVGTDQVGTLSPSGASAESISLTAPSTARAYYYGACVDTVTGESDTTNNCSASVKVDVEAPKYPDLEVGAPRVSDSSPAPGAEFTLSLTVSNVGDGESPATPLRYYRSTDATITRSDTAVGTDQVGTLSPSGASAESISLTAPSTARAYYYGACVDTVTGESDTTNNCSSSVKVTVREPEPAEVEVTPDEVTLAALGNTATLTARVLDAQGNEISGEAVSWSSRFPDVATVDAQGVVTAVANGRATMTASASGVSGTATVIVWQRAESVDIDPGEVELTSVGETALLTLRAIDANGHEAPGGGDLTSWRWQSADPNVATVSPVPVITLEAEVQAVAAGTTTVTVTAVTEDGGSLSATAQVTVTVPEEGKPDLYIQSLLILTDVGNTYPLESFQVGATVWNEGDGPSEATTLRIYRSVDTTVDTSDTQVGTASVAGLAASENASTTISVRSPLSPGTYYYYACVDAVAGESDTTNNCGGSVAVPVVPRGQPDLVVQTPSLAPPFPTAGATFTLTATVWNFAQVVDGTSEATMLRYYRSVDGTVTTSDTQVGTDTVPALGPRGRSTQSVDLTAPSTPGTYYYAACVDAVTDESDTTNNCSNGLTVHVREP